MKHVLLLPWTFLYITGLFAQNVNVSKGFIFDGEPYLAMHPSNPEHLVCAWMGFNAGNISIKTKVSRDGGITWSNVLLIPHAVPTYKSADPSIVFDRTGNLYISFVDYRQNPDSGGIYMVKSTDGGFSFSAPTKVIDAYADGLKKPIDRPWLSINPINDELYITSKPPQWVNAPNRAYFTKSSNGGQNWSPWKYVDTAGFLIGTAIKEPMTVSASGTDGKLHIIFPSWVPSQQILPGFIHAVSSDGGSSFDYNNGYYFNKGSNGDSLSKLGYRLFSDPTDPNHLVMLHVAFLNDEADIYMVESNDGGYNWNAPLRINDDAPGKGIVQDLVWGAFNEKGDLVITWRDRRNGKGSGYQSASDIYAAVRKKGSPSFGKNFVLSDQQSPYIAKYGETNGNDFMCCVFYGDTVRAVWGDVRNNILNIWFSALSVSSGQSTGMQLMASEPAMIWVYPNPAADYIQWNIPEVESITVYDIEGKVILTDHHIQGKNIQSISGLAPGTYYIQFETREGFFKSNFRKL